MRILMLTQSYPPTIGGEQRHVHNLSIELAARGYDVTVATLWKEGMPKFAVDQGVRVHRIHGSLQCIPALFTDKERRHLPPFPDPGMLWALRSIITQEHPDIVHAHNWIVHSFTPLKAWSKAKLVVTLHDTSLICAKQRLMYRGALCSGPGLAKCLGCAAEHYGIARGVPITLANWAWGKIEYHTVDMFLPVSKAIAEANQLARHKVSYKIIPNFVPNDADVQCGDAEPFLAQLPKDNYLLFVGDVTRDKGVGVLLQAYAELESQIPLVLIGRPIIDFSANFPPNVQILQSWPHAAVMRAWSHCIIAVIPSIVLDACPTVVMEAMAMGRPVVASRIGGIPDIVVEGETGLLVAPGDWCALREAIQRLLNDPALRERMGVLAKQRVVEFQARTVVPRIEQVYQEVLQS